MSLRQFLLLVPGLRAVDANVRRVMEVLREEGPTEVFLKTGHRLARALRGGPLLVQPRDGLPPDINEQYQRWLARQRRSAGGDREAPAALEGLTATPIVSLLAAQRVVDVAVLAGAIETLRAQRYPRWELCLAVPVAAGVAAGRPEVEALESGEPRLRIVMTQGEDAELADALRVATGEIVGVFDPHDELHPDALLELLRRLNDGPDLDAAYSDEDVLDTAGRRVDPFFKPEWSPDLLLATNYVARLGLIRRRLVEAVGRIRPGLGDGAAYDLWLRVAEETRGIARVPKVLYHRRTRVPTAASAAEHEQMRAQEGRAVGDALRRRGLDGSVEPLAVPPGTPPAFAPRLLIRGRPLVSIIIPTRDQPAVLEHAIRSVRERTAYDRYEILVVDNDSREQATLRLLDSLAAPCRVLRWPGAFNFSAINNLGARHAEGEQLVLLNNDVVALQPDWLSALLEHAQRPDVGAVGAKLLYPDGRIQHAGVVLGVGGIAGRAFRLLPGVPPAGPRLADLVRNCSAVTAACMMIRRAVFEQVGGFDEGLRVSLNDVDLCLRIRQAGYRIVYTPLATLIHHEGVSRGRRHPTSDARLFRRRWAEALRHVDPYYNPNLTDTREDWSLRT